MGHGGVSFVILRDGVGRIIGEPQRVYIWRFSCTLTGSWKGGKGGWGHA